MSGPPPRGASAPQRGGGGPPCQAGESRPDIGPSSTDGTFRRLVGRSVMTDGRRKSTVRDALTVGRPQGRPPGNPGSPHPVSAGLEGPDAPTRGESHACRNTSEIDGESRAIRVRRRPTITKVNGRPIRGDVGQSAGTESVAGNGTDNPMPTTQAVTDIVPETERVFSPLSPVPVCAGTAARRPERVVVVR